MYSKLVFFLILAYFRVEGVYGIKCYECSVTKQLRNNNATIEQCSEFTESNKFEFDCPYSTMCEKKIVRLQLINKIQTSFERGCAKQKRTSMVYKNSKWVNEVKIEEPYSEGCFNNTEDDTEYCYCRGNLCNSAPRLDIHVMYFITYFYFVVNIVMYAL